jgi:uncharacterized protein
MRVFLDTNIFLYAAGRPHPEKETCAAVLQKVADGSLDATSNSEVVQEILYVLTRRDRRQDALSLARSLIALIPDLLPVTRADMSDACDLLRKYPRLPVRDAVHASTMLRNGVLTVVSVDPNFDQIREVRRILPDSVRAPIN